MKPRISSPFKTYLYSNFAGLSTSRADISSENPELQSLVEMDNLYCSHKGYITNEPGDIKFGTEMGYVSHVRWYDAASDVVIYSTRTGAGTSLFASGSYAKSENIWPRLASVSSAVFNRSVVLAAGQPTMRYYNGSEFKEITSDSIFGARYLCQVSNRLVVAGFDHNPNEVKVSRVDNGRVYDGDEAIGEPSVLRAFRFNIQNMIESGDRIKGVATFETSRIAVFTNDRVLVYVTDPDYTQWSLDKEIMVRYGTISHNSVASAGGELFFCSRTGVHSLRRSMLNGSIVYSSAMSDEVTELYQSLLSQVKNKDDVSAYFNPDDGRLHVIFPINDLLSYRLSASLSPSNGEANQTETRWALSTYGGVTYGDYLAGRVVRGTISGMRLVSPWYSNTERRGAGSVNLPILWHGDIFNPKDGLHIVLYASGSGRVVVTTHDETQRELSVVVFDLPEDDQTDYYGVPLQRQFIRPFQHQYIGVRMSLKVESEKMVRVFAVGLNIKVEPRVK
jgi:hypothetical protein